MDADTDSPYVWVAGSGNKLEKRDVVLGQYDENLAEYEIADGLTEKDRIAFPTEELKEGMSVVEEPLIRQLRLCGILLMKIPRMFLMKITAIWKAMDQNLIWSKTAVWMEI